MKENYLELIIKPHQFFMPIEELKQQLHFLIEASSNEVLLEDLLTEAQVRTIATNPHEMEGLSKEDYEELLSLTLESPEKDTVSFNELKVSLSRWFTN